MRCKPGRKYGNRECLWGIQKAAGRFDTSGLHQHLPDNHRYEVHDENDADHRSDKLLVECSQTFETHEIP